MECPVCVPFSNLKNHMRVWLGTLDCTHVTVSLNFGLVSLRKGNQRMWRCHQPRGSALKL